MVCSNDNWPSSWWSSSELISSPTSDTFLSSTTLKISTAYLRIDWSSYESPGHTALGREWKFQHRLSDYIVRLLIYILWLNCRSQAHETEKTNGLSSTSMLLSDIWCLQLRFPCFANPPTLGSDQCNWNVPSLQLPFVFLSLNHKNINLFPHWNLAL